MRTGCYIILFFCCLADAVIAAPGKPLFWNGQTEWTVCLPAQANETEQFAAKELVSFLKGVSGVDFPVRSGEEIPGKNAIVLGTHEDFPAMAERLEIATGNEQKVSICTVGDNLYLVGRSDRGVLQAVYAFAERYLGVRMFWPDTEADGLFMPHRSNLRLPDIRYQHEPKILYRGYHFLSGVNGSIERFLAFNHGNIIRHGSAGGLEGAVRRRRMGFYCYDTGHIVDPHHKLMKCNIEKMMEQHPEFFALINGQRDASNHFCWSAPGLAEYVAERFEEHLKEFPQIDILGFYPTDKRHYCQCEQCQAHGLSTAWFKLVGQVCAILHQRHPELRFGTLAYEGYRPLPSGVPELLEFTEYCLYDRCFVHPFDCQVNKEVLASGDWHDWVYSGSRLGLYGYEFDLFLEPDGMAPLFLPTYGTFAEQAKFFAENRIFAVIPEITGAGAKGKPNKRVRNRLGLYVYTQLMWNPDAEVKKLINDYCSYVYPLAKQEMEEYFIAFSEQFLKMKLHFNYFLYSPLTAAAEILDNKSIQRLIELLDAAAGKSGSARETREILFERENLAQWIELHWQTKRELTVISRNSPVELPRHEKLEIVWNETGLSIAGGTTVQIRTSDGAAYTVKDGEALPLPFVPGKTVVLSDGDTETVLMASLAKDELGRLVWLVPEDKETEARLSRARRVLCQDGWNVVFASLEDDFQKLKPAVLLCSPGQAGKLSAQQFRTMRKFADDGGIVLLSTVIGLDFAGLAGDTSLALEWTGKREFAVMTRSKRYAWLNEPQPFEALFREFLPPESGYEIPEGSAWKFVFLMRNGDKSCVAAPLLILPSGQGVFLASLAESVGKRQGC